MTLRTFRRALLLTALLAPASAFAQWSKTADYNQVLADGAGPQVQGKLAPRTDGGFYSVWFDNASEGAGYDVHLQRLDVKGRPQWGKNGLLLADRNLSYTTDYGIDVDADGNALTAFHDLSQVDGLFHILVSKVSPEGTPLWGNESGLIRLPDGAANGAMAPRVVAMPDGGAVVAWSGRYNALGQGNVVLQRLDANGAMLWGEQNIQVNPPTGGSFLFTDLHATSDGGVIVSWNAQLGRFINQHWAQKYDANGQPVWATPVKVWDDNASGAIPNGTLPTFVSDGAGGAVFCWDYTFGLSRRLVRAQHVLADGSERFPHNGIAVSTNGDNNRGECLVSYDQASDDTYVLWRERTAGTAYVQSGIYAQRIDGQGNRQWGETGNVILPLDPIEKSQVRMVPMPNGFVAAWTLQAYPFPMPVQAAYITRDGGYGWTQGIVGIKTSATGTGYMSAARSADGYAAFVWSDVYSTNDYDLVGQTIGRDGVLGKKDQGATGK